MSQNLICPSGTSPIKQSRAEKERGWGGENAFLGRECYEKHQASPCSFGVLILFLPRSRCSSRTRGHFLPDTMAHGERISSDNLACTWFHACSARSAFNGAQGPGPGRLGPASPRGTTASVCSFWPVIAAERSVSLRQLVKSTRKLQKPQRITGPDCPETGRRIKRWSPIFFCNQRVARDDTREIRLRKAAGLMTTFKL